MTRCARRQGFADDEFAQRASVPCSTMGSTAGRLRHRGAAVGFALVLLCAACTNTEPARTAAPVSGSATASLVAGVQQVRIEAGDDYRFHPATITVQPGPVRIVLKHTGSGAPHDWQLSGFPKDFVPLVQPGETHSATFTAPAPGSYRFICTIHVQQGQVGTLIVRAGG